MPDEKVGEVEFELRRDLGLFDITMIGIGAMIGAGIFVLTGYAINGAGPAAILVFLLNGLVATLTALTYMELGSCFPQAGGSYLWVREGMPHPFGFLAGWMDWMAHTIACSLYALGFGSYLTWLLNEYNIYLWGYSDIFAKLFAVLIAVILLGINYMGTAATGKTENIVTMAKLGTLFIFIGFGIVPFIHNPGALSNFTDDFLPHGFGGIAYGMGLTFIAFEGFEVIAQCGEEVKDPRKNIPKAIMYSLVVVIAIYLAIAFVVIIAVGTNIGDKPELVIVEAARKFMGPIGFVIMIIGGLVSTVSALNATVFSSSRVSFAMGRDGTLPKSLGKIHQERRTPSNAIMLTGGILIIMAVALPIEDVAASAGVMFLILFSLANISLITLRRKMPYLQRGFVVPFVPLIPMVAVGLNISLAIYLFFHNPLSWYIAIAWIEFGLIGYYFTRGKEEIGEIDKVEKLIGVPRRETGKSYHVLVPIANPKNTELIDFASAVVKNKDGDMILLNIAAIPDNLPIQNVDYEFVNRRVKTAEGLSDYSKTKHNVITRARVVVSHKIRDTILEVVNKEKANLTIIGWTGKPPRGRIMFGYNIDDIIQFAKSDVAILRGPLKGEVKRILVLPGYGLHAQRTAELAAYMAKDHNASVDVVGVVTPDKTEAQIVQETRSITDIIRRIGVPVQEQILQTKTPVRKLITFSKDYDFLMIGASKRWKLLRYAFGPIQDSVANKVELPLLMLRAYEKEEKMLSTSKLGEEKEDKPDQADKDQKKVEKPIAIPVDDDGNPIEPTGHAEEAPPAAEPVQDSQTSDVTDPGGTKETTSFSRDDSGKPGDGEAGNQRESESTTSSPGPNPTDINNPHGKASNPSQDSDLNPEKTDMDSKEKSADAEKQSSQSDLTEQDITIPEEFQDEEGECETDIELEEEEQLPDDVKTSDNNLNQVEPDGSGAVESEEKADNEPAGSSKSKDENNTGNINDGNNSEKDRKKAEKMTDSDRGDDHA